MACSKENLETVKRLYTSTPLSGIYLGLAANNTDSTVLDWLLEQNCPTTGDTWLYIAGLPNSVDLVKRISAKVRVDYRLIITHAIADNDPALYTYAYPFTT